MYAILGHKGAFSVKIDSNEDVAELINKLKTSDDVLAHVNIRDITLFKVEIPVPDTPTFESVNDSISQHSVQFKREDELKNPFLELSAIPDGFPKRTLHILVEVPARESFSSRPGCDVAEIVLSLTTPTIHYRPTFISLIIYHSPITPSSSNIDLDAVRVLRGLTCCR